MDFERLVEENSRKQTLNKLKQLYEKGYRYVVRDKDMPYLSCYSLKPKRYREIEGWGYVNPNAKSALMAFPLKNTDIGEINYSNRSPVLISEFLTKDEER